MSFSWNPNTNKNMASLTAYRECKSFPITDDLKKFCSAKMGEEFKSDEFECGPSIKWYLKAMPNGSNEIDEGQCMLYLVLSSYPDHFSRIVIHYQLHCAETSSNFSLIKTFSNPNDYAVWFRGVLTNDELQNLDLNKVKKLEFQCTINILRIEADKNVLYSYPLEIDLSKKTEFILEWKIKDEMLEQFRKAKHGKFISNNFVYDEIWALQCAPNGYRNDDEGSVRLFMQLRALPNGIKSIDLQRTLECLEVNVDRKYTKPTAWGYNIDGRNKTNRQNSGWGKDALLKKDVAGLDEINFRVIVNILGYEKEDGTKVSIPQKTDEKREKKTEKPKTIISE